MRREETGCIDCTRDYCRTHRHTVRLLATAVRARTHGCSSSADDADHRARPRDSLHAPVLPFLCTVHRRNNAQCSGLSKILATVDPLILGAAAAAKTKIQQHVQQQPATHFM